MFSVLVKIVVMKKTDNVIVTYEIGHPFSKSPNQ